MFNYSPTFMRQYFQNGRFCSICCDWVYLGKLCWAMKKRVKEKKPSFWLNEPLQLSLVPQKKHLNATKIGSLGLNSEKLHTWIGLLFLFSRFSSNSNFMYGNLCAIQMEACTQTKDATTVQRWIERMTEICMLPKMYTQNKQILLYQSENETEWNFL